MKTRTINNRVFEEVTGKSSLGETIVRDRMYVKGWYELYKNPSAKKEKIQEDWSGWFTDTALQTDHTTTIKGYLGGIQTFSIYGTVDGYPVKITPCHNYIVTDYRA